MCSMVPTSNARRDAMQVQLTIKIVSLSLSLIFDSSTKTARFNDVMARVDTESCDCLPDCDSTEYQYAVTSSPLRWGVFLEINRFFLDLLGKLQVVPYVL